jgi:dihydropteroate synthase
MAVMNRKIYYWKLRESEMQLGERTLIMGVINLTPDSFSDGGRFNDPDRAYARALELEEQGADIIDIGAESTRPGSKRITAEEEWQRLVPVLKRLRGQLRAPLSLDTYKAEIAERALEYGVEIFNDPSGLTFDPGLAKVAANGNAGLILNHMRGQPETWAKLPPMQDPIGSVSRDLDATVSRARHAGVDKARIVIDPGLGFGKRKEQNAEIVAHLRELAVLDYPILVGASRKSFLAQATEADTTFATAGAVAAAVLNGAHIVRVHDVKQMQSVLLVADEIAHAAGIVRVAQSEPVAAPRVTKAGAKAAPYEEERVRPTRPPLLKTVPKPVEKPAVEVSKAEESAVEMSDEAAPEITLESQPEVLESESVVAEAAAKPAPKATPKPKPVILPAAKMPYSPAARPPVRPPGKFSADRDAARTGFKPPVRRPSTDSDRERRPAARRPDAEPPRSRDFRPGGPKKPFTKSFTRDDSRPPRREYRPDGPPPRTDRPSDRGTGRPPSRPPSDRFKSDGPPRRTYEPRGGESRSGPPRAGRPPSGPPPSGPPRSGPPRSGPPRSGPPGAGKSGPPKRPFRKRP